MRRWERLGPRVIISITRSYLHKGVLDKYNITILILKKVYTLIAASKMLLSTSARFRSKRILVARMAMSDFLFILTEVPNYKAKAVMKVLARSQMTLCP